MKVNIWRIEGYCGRSEWDGPMDNNVHKDLAFDASFSKEEVERIFFGLNKKYRCVVLDNCEIIKVVDC